MTLAQAREKALQHRAQVGEGADPIRSDPIASHLAPRCRECAAAQRHAQQTFTQVAAHYIAQHCQSWKSEKHCAQWASTLRLYAEPILGSLLVRDINAAHVIRILEPIWISKTETAMRVRSRIKLVLDFAAARGLREGPNPARWRGNLDAALPKASKVSKVVNHMALVVDRVGPFMSHLQMQPGLGTRALEFAVLTAARSGEVRCATWSEMNLSAALWTVPAGRMKSGREHRVPLSALALTLLRALPGGTPGQTVFPGLRGPLSDMSLTAVLRRMKVEVTVHGFRSTCRDWVAEFTHHSHEVAEMALAHAVGDKVEAAYRRGDRFEKRVSSMKDWAEFPVSKKSTESSEAQR